MERLIFLVLLSLGVEVWGDLSWADGWVEVRHRGGYVARVEVSYFLDGMALTAESGDFTLGFTRKLTIPGGATNVRVKVEAAVFIQMWRTVFEERFDGAVKRRYEVSGTTLATRWKEVEIGAHELPPAGFPLNAELREYLNWAQDIGSEGVWTCTPRTAEQVVAVANWAAGAGYRVRAVGKMHGWAPLTIADGAKVGDKVVLVDMTQMRRMQMNGRGAGGWATVTVEAGAQMQDLLAFLEEQEGGLGDAPGYSFTNTPAPGDLTVGGVLAIGGHGTALVYDGMKRGVETLGAFGTLSNAIVEMTVVATDPDGEGTTYGVRKIGRGEAAAKAFAMHLGRALVLEVTLRVMENANMRCVSTFGYTADELFAPPGPGGEAGPRTLGALALGTGFVESILFPWAGAPWLKIWSYEPTQPATSKRVTEPFNYPFSDQLPRWVESLLATILDGETGLTKTFGRAMAAYTESSIRSGGLGDLWGPSKNLLMYVRPSTMKMTANGYVILTTRGGLQKALHKFYAKYVGMMDRYAEQGKYGVNGPLEVRVTGLEDPAYVGVPGAEVPVLSAANPVPGKAYDVAIWLDNLTMSRSKDQHEFYAELEAWLFTADGFANDETAVRPEWSKGWGYATVGGPWAHDDFVTRQVPRMWNEGRPADANFDWVARTLTSHDRANLYTNPLLTSLMPHTP